MGFRDENHLYLSTSRAFEKINDSSATERLENYHLSILSQRKYPSYQTLVEVKYLPLLPQSENIWKKPNTGLEFSEASEFYHHLHSVFQLLTQHLSTGYMDLLQLRLDESLFQELIQFNSTKQVTVSIKRNLVVLSKMNHCPPEIPLMLRKMRKHRLPQQMSNFHICIQRSPIHMDKCMGI